MSFLRYRKIFYVFSGALALGGLLSIFIFGLPLSHEFTGGALLEIEFPQNPPAISRVEAVVREAHIPSPAVQMTRPGTYIIRSSPIDETVHQQLVARLGALGGKVVERRFETIGPTIGKELRVRSIWVLVVSLLAIYIYVMAAFRNTSGRPRSSVYALVGILTLIHDVFITAGLLSIINLFMPLEIGAPVVAAFLVIFGYSINDTIIVYDRIRELRRGARNEDVGMSVDRAIFSTLRRSLFTSFATLLSLIAIFFLGGETLKTFALALVIGISIGTYSSICIASPLLVDLAPRGRGPLSRAKLATGGSRH